MKKAISLLLIFVLLIGMVPALAAGPAGTLSVYFYDEAAGRYGELIQTDRVNMTLDGAALTPEDVPGHGDLGARYPPGHPDQRWEHHRAYPGLRHGFGERQKRTAARRRTCRGGKV